MREKKRGGKPPHACYFVVMGLNALLLEQCEHVLRRSVRLGKHRRTGLLQNLRAGQVGGFRGKVGILDT